MLLSVTSLFCLLAFLLSDRADCGVFQDSNHCHLVFTAALIVGVERTQELLPELGEETRHKEAVVREGYMGKCLTIMFLRCVVLRHCRCYLDFLFLRRVSSWLCRPVHLPARGVRPGVPRVPARRASRGARWYASPVLSCRSFIFVCVFVVQVCRMRLVLFAKPHSRLARCVVRSLCSLCCNLLCCSLRRVCLRCADVLSGLVGMRFFAFAATGDDVRQVAHRASAARAGERRARRGLAHPVCL